MSKTKKLLKYYVKLENEIKVIKNLPFYWQLMINRNECPYDGAGLFKVKKPVEHKKCFRCRRIYI